MEQDVATIPRIELADSSTEEIMVIPPLRRAASMLASPVAIKPRMDVAQAWPMRLPAWLEVAATPDFTSVYQTPITGDLAVAQPVNTAAVRTAPMMLFSMNPP